MKRVFYVSNAYDGSYFVISDDVEEYFQRLAAYAMNLQTSSKTNTYTFGSIEMSDSEYRKLRGEAETFEKNLIRQKAQQIEEDVRPEIKAQPPEQEEIPYIHQSLIKDKRPKLRLIKSE